MKTFIIISSAGSLFTGASIDKDLKECVERIIDDAMNKSLNRPIGLIAMMAEAQLNALKKGEMESFMESFCMDGEVESCLKGWFDKFKTKAAVSGKTTMSALQIEKCIEGDYDVWIVIDLNYEGDDSASTAFHYKIKYHETQKKIVIAKASIL